MEVWTAVDSFGALNVASHLPAGNWRRLGSGVESAVLNSVAGDSLGL